MKPGKHYISHSKWAILHHVLCFYNTIPTKTVISMYASAQPHCTLSAANITGCTPGLAIYANIRAIKCNTTHSVHLVPDDGICTLNCWVKKTIHNDYAETAAVTLTSTLIFNIFHHKTVTTPHPHGAYSDNNKNINTSQTS